MRYLPTFLALAFLSLAAAALGACGTSSSGAPAGGSDDAGMDAAPVCNATSCLSDTDCAGCTGGHTACNTPTHTCAAPYVPDAGKDTGADVKADTGPACPVDGSGNPTLSCAKDGDCAVCDAFHQVCDTTMMRCVRCTATESSACGTSSTCSTSDTCVPACPPTCASDDACAHCGAPGMEAHACNGTTCAQCSATQPCTAPQVCGHDGTCVNTCGTDGMGACTADANCNFCGAATTCHLPINGGTGVCSVPASGCSQLGNGVLTLPAPYSDITNTCSTSADCKTAGVGIEYNVGKLLRQLTGVSSINDANIFYGMDACAALTVSVGSSSLSCGVCVPCVTDSDCQPLDVDQVTAQAFGPLGPVVTDLLLTQLFGQSDHKIHTYCQPVAAGYGACVPCSSITSVCGAN